MNWSSLALVVVSGVLSLGIVASWTVLIVSGFAAEVPEVYATLLPALVTGGLLGAAFRQGENKSSS